MEEEEDEDDGPMPSYDRGVRLRLPMLIVPPTPASRWTKALWREEDDDDDDEYRDDDDDDDDDDGRGIEYNDDRRGGNDGREDVDDDDADEASNRLAVKASNAALLIDPFIFVPRCFEI
mmetsp:Transcript_19286/g.31183  ORF Transcript_19286/g.31183 Transcript_19286/m.31183 type:complete len:119 (+) Transcript_19286:2545-2901(+)